MSWQNYQRKQNYRTLDSLKNTLTNELKEVSPLNNFINSMNEQLRDAVKGDYYGVGSGEFEALKEKSSDSDSKIISAKNSILQEMAAIQKDIAAEEAARKLQEEREKAERLKANIKNNK